MAAYDEFWSPFSMLLTWCFEFCSDAVAMLIWDRKIVFTAFTETSVHQWKMETVGKKSTRQSGTQRKKKQILPLWHPVSLHVCIALPMPLKMFAYANTPLNAAAGGKKAKVFSLLLTSSSSIPLPAPCNLPDPRHCWDKVLLPPMAERHKPGTTHRKSSGAGVCCHCHL